MKVVFILCLLFNVGFTFGQDCPDTCEVYIPNNVTPDCDGIDCHFLFIQSNCTFKKYGFTVFDQWGNIVFESDDPEDRFSSKEVDEAIYLYQLKATYCNGEKVTKRGYVQVLK